MTLVIVVTVVLCTGVVVGIVGLLLGSVLMSHRDTAAAVSRRDTAAADALAPRYVTSTPAAVTIAPVSDGAAAERVIALA